MYDYSELKTKKIGHQRREHGVKLKVPPNKRKHQKSLGNNTKNLTYMLWKHLFKNINKNILLYNSEYFCFRTKPKTAQNNKKNTQEIEKNTYLH